MQLLRGGLYHRTLTNSARRGTYSCRFASIFARDNIKFSYSSSKFCYNAVGSTRNQSCQPKSKITYGVSSWSYLRKSHTFYADKTNYIRLLESTGLFLKLSRPRRFGKTLFCDQLYSYYDILTDEKKVNNVFSVFLP